MTLGALALGGVEVALGGVNDGLGCVNVRTSGLLGVGVGRLVGAGLLRNDLGALGGLGATERLREAAGVGRLGDWMRGAGLGEGLGVAGLTDREPDHPPGALPRDLNASRTDLGWAAKLEWANANKVSNEAMPPIQLDFILACTRHMTIPPARIGDPRPDVHLPIEVIASLVPGRLRHCMPRSDVTQHANCKRLAERSGKHDRAITRHTEERECRQAGIRVIEVTTRVRPQGGPASRCSARNATTTSFRFSRLAIAHCRYLRAESR